MEYPFVHLHNHSEFSLLDGSIRVADLAKKTAQSGMSAIALTDHGNMFGALYFQKACQKAGIKPIIGCEVYIAPKGRQIKDKESRYYHMCLFCKDETGYKNLLYLTSQASIDGFYHRPRIDDALLQSHHEGLICSSACLGGEIAQHLLRNRYEVAKERALFYQELFGEGNFYLEIQDHGYSEEQRVRHLMVQLAKETGIPLIATNDIHYLEPEDKETNDILICIGTQRKLKDSSRMSAADNCYFRSAEEMYALFSDVPEALTNTVELANKCNLVIPESGPILPEYTIPEPFANPTEYLRHLVFAGLKERYPEVTPELSQRAEFEIETIASMQFSGYFLIVWDFIDWAKRHDISVGPGRGSGAGSLVAYALKITDVDPIKYNLLFERFLNPERVSMPDFDIDFNDDRRDEVVAYVTEKYGADHVAGITTFGTLATKAALKDVARVLDIAFDESLKITKAVDETALPEEQDVKLNVTTARTYNPYLKSLYQQGGSYKQLFDVAAKIEGLTRHIGTHACGKVIGKSPVVEYVPLIFDQRSGSINTAFESKIIEDCGLVKMDFLGLKTLSIIDNTVAMIRKEQPDFHIDRIPEDDALTFKLFCEGRTHAIFQFESEGMQKILKDAQPSSIEDLIALNALYRPGPMQFIPAFIKGKRNPSRVKYFHPSLKEILKPTYGVIVYQEQVMQVAQIYAGYSLGGADLLRRAMGKKKKEEMDKQEQIFIEGAIQNGHTREAAAELFQILLPFAGYGFNKSHAAAYSIIAYQTAYLKAHYPAQFMAANLSNEMNSSPKSFMRALDETRSMGIPIFPPEINHSEGKFTAREGKIYYGLLGMKGLGEAAAGDIIRVRENIGAFTSFIHFLEELAKQNVAPNKRVVETLILAGLFDKIEPDRTRSFLRYHANKACDWATKIANIDTQENSLFDQMEAPSYAPFAYTDMPDYEEDAEGNHQSNILTAEEILALEHEILGFYVSGHPLEPYRRAWERQQNINLLELEQSSKQNIYTVIGLMKHLSIRPTKKGSLMASATLEDFNGSITIVLFSKILTPDNDKLLKAREGKALGVQGKIELDRGADAQLLVEHIFVPEENDDVFPIKSCPTDTTTHSERPAQAIYIYLKEQAINQKNISSLKFLLQKHEGALHVKIIIGGKEGITLPIEGMQVSANLTIDPLWLELKSDLIEETEVAF
ncbi:DNA polymerase III subunit alpha [Entomospira culicis]|uniref:DNA polymerase III subunit alpha n=1 Tax=Entomospira culicis TaxID=2719989 RepID=A0A968GHM5_9SPIO|nr:DNA polymerase III subunit alpha [Entomospira culicis]NIZ18934.1 DNA polymerase III subunit alpha [Entomospira culicis]NIZ69149.1 DNA polymerase III subunit alpha [Entomospira culicis]WDI37735.1 DNA polymerase III subunit alpha [Entomospira culicis]WDI39363.1 DNA polymerase III subunit alpha [Entomospira culicis]